MTIIICFRASWASCSRLGAGLPSRSAHLQRPELTRACGDGAGRVLAIMRAIDARRPAGLPPHFHVMFVGVRPEYRKQGAAIEILRALGQALTEAGAGVRPDASSPHNLVLGQRFGVTVSRTDQRSSCRMTAPRSARCGSTFPSSRTSPPLQHGDLLPTACPRDGLSW